MPGRASAAGQDCPPSQGLVGGHRPLPSVLARSARKMVLPTRVWGRRLRQPNDQNQSLLLSSLLPTL